MERAKVVPWCMHVHIIYLLFQQEEMNTAVNEINAYKAVLKERNKVSNTVWLYMYTHVFCEVKVYLFCSMKYKCLMNENLPYM